MQIKNLIFLSMIILLTACKTISFSIDETNNSIVYSRTTYKTIFNYSNGEYIEGNKIRIITEYFDKNENIVKVIDENNLLIYNHYIYDNKEYLMPCLFVL
jgi:hypothetical protein